MLHLFDLIIKSIYLSLDHFFDNFAFNVEAYLRATVKQLYIGKFDTEKETEPYISVILNTVDFPLLDFPVEATSQTM